MRLLKTYPSSYYVLYSIFFTFFISHNILSQKPKCVSDFCAFTINFYKFIFKRIAFPKFTFQLKVKDFKLNHIIIVFLIIFPSIIFLNNISFGDFNWGGDHRDHVLATLVNNEFWLSSIASERDTIENF